MTVQIVIIILEEQNVLITINFTLFVYATFSPNICLKKILCVGVKNCNMLATNSIYQTPHQCPSKTSVCYGCSQTLKPNGVILNQPHDLVIVSNMEREWHDGNMVHKKYSNVYFHCCVQMLCAKKGIAVTFTLAFQQACCSFWYPHIWFF